MQLRLRRVLSRLVLAGTWLALASTAATARSPTPSQQSRQTLSYLQAQMQSLHIPGLQVAVVKDGRIVLLRSLGLANVELGVPMTNDTTLAINSVTKAFTGVAAMRLVERGKLDLAAPVANYLDGLPPAWQAITLRQLLSHMSGLPDINRAPTVDTDAAAAWAWVLARPLNFAPGTRFEYCQTNYTLVQRVVNRLEAAPRDDAPLAGWQIAAVGMTHTRYGDSTEVVPGKAPSYRLTFETPGAPGVLRPVTERFLPLRRASSGLNSSAQDLARWIIALQDRRLLKKASSLQTLWSPLAFNDGKPGQWGIGWMALPRGDGHAVGMTGGGRAALFVYPQHDLAVVILTNLAGAFPEDFIDRVATIYAPELKLSGVPALRLALESRGYQRAAAAAASIQQADPGLVWNEAELNDWGYRLLSGGRAQQAFAVLELVTQLFPESANAYDSFAEACAATGNKAAAIAHYERSLELDPDNQNAQRQLLKLRKLKASAPAAP